MYTGYTDQQNFFFVQRNNNTSKHVKQKNIKHTNNRNSHIKRPIHLIDDNVIEICNEYSDRQILFSNSRMMSKEYKQKGIPGEITNSMNTHLKEVGVLFK